MCGALRIDKTHAEKELIEFFTESVSICDSSIYAARCDVIYYWTFKDSIFLHSKIVLCMHFSEFQFSF